MKIPAIKKLVEQYDQHQLIDAEADLVDEKPLNIDVDGEDEGEKLTHIFAAIFIKEMIEEKNVDFKTALRE